MNESDVKSVTVFGSGTITKSSAAWQEAYNVGCLLAKAQFTLVCGGYQGAMLASASGARSACGRTIGVTTDEFSGAQVNPFIDEEIRKPSWRERLHELINLADAYVVLDGGTGTLTELMVAWEMGSKGLHRKPMVVLGSFMKEMVQLLEKSPQVDKLDSLRVVSTPQEVVSVLTHYFSNESS